MTKQILLDRFFHLLTYLLVACGFSMGQIETKAGLFGQKKG